MIAELQNTVRQIFRVTPRAAQSDSQPNTGVSPLIIALFASLITPLSANGQIAPNPPDPFCVEGAACGSSTGGTVENKKWNPGHYLKPQGNHATSDREAFYSSVTSQLAKTADSPEIIGAHLAYSWGMVEPVLGTYDFAPIYRHLDYLSSRGLKAIITINTKCFGTDCGGLAPADLQSEVFVTPKDPPTLTMELWEAQNMDLYIRLWQALAVEFDGNPAVEMISGAESTPSLQGSSPVNYSKAAYAAQLKRLYAAQGAAFQHTNVIANINFLSGEVSDLIESAYQSGVGRGMPDIFDSAGTVVFRGECDTENNDCGVRDYRGLVPHFGVASYQQLIGKFSTNTDSPAETITYGVENKITHYSWVSNESGEDSWANIISAIESANPDGYTGCPTAYTKGCD